MIHFPCEILAIRNFLRRRISGKEVCLLIEFIFMSIYFFHQYISRTDEQKYGT